MIPSIFGTGHPESLIMIVGEFKTKEDNDRQEFFSGKAGTLLDELLRQAGSNRSECYLTNVGNFHFYGEWFQKRSKNLPPPQYVEYKGMIILRRLIPEIERLHKEVRMMKPKVIIALGNLALWALTGETGIEKWRGSELEYIGGEGSNRPVVVPTFAPTYMSWVRRATSISALDFHRAILLVKQDCTLTEEREMAIRPNYEIVTDVLDELVDDLKDEQLWIDIDIETRAGHISCIGLSWSSLDSMCIPFMCVEKPYGYWDEFSEARIVHGLYKVLTHPNAFIRGQNLLYDCQYIYRYWHFVPNVKQDTMISHHTLFTDYPNNLAFMSSIYCAHYRNWKDEGKKWFLPQPVPENPNEPTGEDQLWYYNLKDCFNTRECGEVTQLLLERYGLSDIDAFQQRMFYPILRAMQIGVRIDLEVRAALNKQLVSQSQIRTQELEYIVGHPINPKSPKQMCEFFYTDLRQPPVMSKATKTSAAHPTCDDDALQQIKAKEPLLAPIVDRIEEIRSLGTLNANFIECPLDYDNRMRCSYNPAGTTTYRLSSSENAFGTGTNLQNVHSGRVNATFSTPNIKTMFIPDPGYTFFDCDLDRADLYTVVWESGEQAFKDALHRGVDMHLLTAFDLLELDISPDLIIEGTESHKELKNKYKNERDFSKRFVHGTNYLGSAATMAKAAGITTAKSAKYQAIYFERHPGIAAWHERVKESLLTKGYVLNAFGYKFDLFERSLKYLTEAVAWIPQSTTSCVINRVWVNLYDSNPEIQVLLQTHDSLAGQFPTHLLEESLAAIQKAGQVIVPYPDPMIIPISTNYSDKSWGDCK